MAPGSVSWVGTPAVGSVVMAQIGGWPAGTSVTYQWLRDDVPIGGATSPSFGIPASLVGSSLRVLATGNRTGYSAASSVSESRTVTPGTFSAATPRISGTARVGRTLKVRVGSWSPRPSTFHYRWYANGKRIASKGTRSWIRLTSKQRGKRITVRVTGTKSGYTTVIKTSKRTKRVAQR
jgi:hypothetical protein